MKKIVEGSNGKTAPANPSATKHTPTDRYAQRTGKDRESSTTRV